MESEYGEEGDVVHIMNSNLARWQKHQVNPGEVADAKSLIRPLWRQKDGLVEITQPIGAIGNLHGYILAVVAQE